MAYEIKELLKLNDGTLRKPVYEVYDEFGSTDWNVTRATFSLKHVNTGVVIAQGDSDNAGECAVNNQDLDRAGNTIKTVQPTIDLRGTDAERGSHKLSFHLYLDNNEDDVVRQLVQIVDFESVA